MSLELASFLHLEVSWMLGAILVGSFVLLVGPMSYFFGADSRV